jgi:hypothetical protein
MFSSLAERIILPKIIVSSSSKRWGIGGCLGVFKNPKKRQKVHPAAHLPFFGGKTFKNHWGQHGCVISAQENLQRKIACKFILS